MPPSVSCASSSSSSKPTAVAPALNRRARSTSKPAQLVASPWRRAWKAYSPQAAKISASSASSRGLPERPAREPGRVLHVPHPVVMIEVLARDLLGGAEMGVLAEARHGARAARGVRCDHRVQIGEAELAAALPGVAHLRRLVDVAGRAAAGSRETAGAAPGPSGAPGLALLSRLTISGRSAGRNGSRQSSGQAVRSH